MAHRDNEARDSSRLLANLGLGKTGDDDDVEHEIWIELAK